jgi:hypothetical protein
METAKGKWGLRLSREGMVIGEIPLDTEEAANAAYWQMASDPLYKEIGVEFVVTSPRIEIWMVG